MLFLIAYDVADPKRLRRVARVLEKWATRCQKSVFVLQGDADRLDKAMQAVSPLIVPELDVVQAWRLASDEDADGWTLGSPRPICPAGIVIAGTTVRSIGKLKSRPSWRNR